MTNPLAGLLLDAGRQEPGKVLLRTATGEAWTYADLDGSSARLAHVLGEGFHVLNGHGITERRNFRRRHGGVAVGVQREINARIHSARGEGGDEGEDRARGVADGEGVRGE